ncbi:MAG: kynureninase [Gemmatimonadetes bacterium]|nr:kynureninase [Gemmatimonadota bacterium]
MDDRLDFRMSAADMDAGDELSSFRPRFHFPRTEYGADTVYLVGHSLGLQPKAARDYVDRELEAWRRLGVEGHFEGDNPWMPYHEALTEPLARLAGALPGEVVAMNTLTVNLHLMLVSFYRPTPERHRILIEDAAFPSDQYAVASQSAWHGYDPAESVIELRPREGEDAIRTGDVEELLEREGETIALVFLGGVNYLTGQAFDMERITEAGRRQGCVVGYDLAHAMGNLELRLHDWDVDFAVWCSYKYLNGGPGCVGGCFVHERHGRRGDLPRFAGWWGHDKSTRFWMPSVFEATPGAEGWQLSNPPILPLAALRASLELFDEAGMDRLRAKSRRLTGYLVHLLRTRFPDGPSIISPADPEQRGCQISFRTGPEGRRVHRHLAEHGIWCDWREPDVIRVAPVPLYNSYSDIHRFVEVMAEGMGSAG